MKDELQVGVEEVRGRALALQADLLQLGVPGFGDPVESLLNETRRRLSNLHRELTESTFKQP